MGGGDVISEAVGYQMCTETQGAGYLIRATTGSGENLVTITLDFNGAWGE